MFVNIIFIEVLKYGVYNFGESSKVSKIGQNDIPANPPPLLQLNGSYNQIIVENLLGRSIWDFLLKTYNSKTLF